MGNRVTLLQLCKPWGHLVKNPNFREGMGCSLLPPNILGGSYSFIYVQSDEHTIADPHLLKELCGPPS